MITALPTPPSRSDPANFSDRADAFLGALPTFATEANALATDVNNKQVTASSAATTATAAALAATAASGATLWVSGTSYTAGNVVWSPTNFLSYRRKTNGAGTTDPVSDTTNWAQVTGTGNVTSDGNGNVGIGAASPSANARLYAFSSTFASSIVNESSSTGSSHYADLLTTNGTVTGRMAAYSSGHSTRANQVWLGTNSSHDLILMTGAVEKARLNVAGDLFVGTNSTTVTAGYRTIAINGSTGGYAHFQSNGTLIGAVGAEPGQFSVKATTSGAPIVFSTATGEVVRFRASGEVIIASAGGGLYFEDMNRRPMLSNGYDGSQDYTSLAVTASNNTGVPGHLRFYTGNYSGLAERMRIHSNGNVSIGNTSNNGWKLEVTSSVGQGIQHTDGTRAVILTTDATLGSIVGTNSNHGISLVTNNAARITITAAGVASYQGSEIGFRDFPVNNCVSNSDMIRGNLNYFYSGSTTVIIPSVRTAGNSFYIFNGTGAAITINGTSTGVNVYNALGLGTRTLANYGYIIMTYLQNNAVLVTGNGLT